MKTIAFTIVAKNYIGLAQILGQSIHRYNPEVEFCIYVADELGEAQQASLPESVIIAKEVLRIDQRNWTDMSFKYDLTEFCTALKPFCFEHIFLNGYKKAFYFDPDIYVFGAIDPLIKSLETHSMTLTPQVAGIHVNYQGEHPEWAMNVNGIFNLGFCGIKNDKWGSLVIQWWKERLRDHAFTDRSVGEFTDQKWMDWVPGFLGDKLEVQHSLGMNLAPWNYFEREVFKQDGKWKVRYRTNDCPAREDEVVFVHFAGYDYTELKKGNIVRKRIEDLKNYDDIDAISSEYRDAIVAQAALFDAYIDEKYSYGHYDNGVAIANFHRRLYHGLPEIQKENPFSTQRGSYYDSLRRHGLIVCESVDHIKRSSISDLGRIERLLAIFYRTLFRMIGYKRYVMFLKSLYFYCRPEKHIFLIK